MKNTSKIKIVFIDWNKTLSFSLFWEQLKDPSHDRHKYHQVINKWLFIENTHRINGWMKGHIATRDLLQVMSEETGIDYEVLEDELSISCRNMVFSHERIPGLIKDIRSKGIKVAVATDNMDTFRNYTIEAMSLSSHFDDFLISSELGALKDDSEPKNKLPFFDNYLKSSGYTYENAILLDDSPDKTGKYALLNFARKLVTSPDQLVEELEDIAST